MTQSMTAFARNDITVGNVDISLELRSVNHRYLDISIRAPEDVREIEQTLRELVSHKLGRGKVELNIRTQNTVLAESETDIELDMPLVKQLAKASESIAQQLKNSSAINPLDILHWPGVIQAKPINSEELHKNIKACLQQALDDFVETRKREGEKLAAMLLNRCDEMEQITTEVSKLLPDILQARKQKIQQRLKEFDVDSDDKRIEQEMVLLAQKMDVAEELDRLGAHLNEVRNVLKQNKPVGRRLDFLMQELNREANTLGSKSVDTATTRASVDLKVLIEQMREQVQNIE